MYNREPPYKGYSESLEIYLDAVLSSEVIYNETSIKNTLRPWKYVRFSLNELVMHTEQELVTSNFIHFL